MADLAEKTKTTNSVFDPMWAGIPEPRVDGRVLENGVVIPARFYADQPYLARTGDGGLLCVLTTGTGHEGAGGQHVVALKSFDDGFTWGDPVPVEESGGPEASWGVPFVAPGGRVFVFYVHNTDDLRELPADDPPYPGGKTQRMDSHGYYVFRWSDDHGTTWSSERVEIPVREFVIDRENPTGGKIRLFWNVGKAFAVGNSLFLPVHKVGGLGEGWFTRSEGALLRSDDLLTASDPRAATWETLPEGDVGICAPEGGGPVGEEHSFTVLDDGSFFTVFRTIDGYPACAYSRNQGRTWEPSEYMCYADGRRIKNPRAANFAWRLPDGGYLYWFHNHGGKQLGAHPKRRTASFNGRNPVWFCRGWEVDGPNGREIKWSQPEIGLYQDDPMVRMSYPDFHALEDGTLLVTQTQKAMARIHRVDESVARALSADAEKRGDALGNLRPIASWSRSSGHDSFPFPRIPVFVSRDPQPPYGGRQIRSGFCIDLDLCGTGVEPEVLANFENAGMFFRLEWTSRRSLVIALCDGETWVQWESDPVPPGTVDSRFTINVDGGSNTISFYRDGAINDGGDERAYGWGRISPFFRGVTMACDDKEGSVNSADVSGRAKQSSSQQVSLASGDSCRINRIVFYERILTSAEITILVEKERVEMGISE